MAEKVISFGEAVSEIIAVDKWFNKTPMAGAYNNALKNALQVHYDENTAYSASDDMVGMVKMRRECAYKASVKGINNARNDADIDKINEIMDSLSDNSVTIAAPSVKQTFINLSRGKIGNIYNAWMFKSRN